MRKVLCCALVFMFSLAAFSQRDYFNRPNVVHFEFDFGQLEPETGSQYFDFLEETTTFDRGDLDGLTFQFRALYQLDNRIAIGGGFAQFDESLSSEDRLYVDQTHAPIIQTNTLETTWGGVFVVWTPFGAGEKFGSRGWAPRRFVPYLSTGVGIKDWELRATGEFVDNSDPSDPLIFEDRFVDDGNVFSVRLGLGFRVNLHKNLDLNFAFETDFAEDDLDESFTDFGDLDLDSKSAFIGIIFRL